MSKFYERITALCKSKDIYITEMCTAVGLSTAVATKWKNGSIPQKATLQKLADYFGVTVDYLLGYEDDPNKAPMTEARKQLLKIVEEMSDEDVEAMLRLFAKK